MKIQCLLTTFSLWSNSNNNIPLHIEIILRPYDVKKYDEFGEHKI